MRIEKGCGYIELALDEFRAMKELPKCTIFNLFTKNHNAKCQVDTGVTIDHENHAILIVEEGCKESCNDGLKALAKIMLDADINNKTTTHPIKNDDLPTLIAFVESVACLYKMVALRVELHEAK
jgi:hypothetical protein